MVQYLLDLGVGEVIVSEQGQIETFFHPKVKKYFLQSDGLFWKTKLYNEGVGISQYDFLWFNDVDVIVPQGNIIKGLDLLKKVHVIDPYNKIYYFDQNWSEIVLNSGFKPNRSFSHKMSGVISGGAFGIRKSVFFPFELGCIGWGYEDDIYDMGIKKFGLKVKKFHYEESFHLFHPQHVGQSNNLGLYKKYLKGLC